MGQSYIQPGYTSHHKVWPNVKRNFILRIVGLALILAIIGLILALPAASTTGNKPTANSQTPAPKPFNVANPSTPAPSTAGGSSISTDVNSSTSTSTNASGHSSTSMHLSVNGQNIPVPANGSTQQTLTSPDGSTTNVSASQSSDGNSYNSSFTSTTQSTSNSSFQSDGDQSSGP